MAHGFEGIVHSIAPGVFSNQAIKKKSQVQLACGFKHGCAANNRFDLAFDSFSLYHHRSWSVEGAALMDMERQFRPVHFVQSEQISTQAAAAVAIDAVFVYADIWSKHPGCCDGYIG